MIAIFRFENKLTTIQLDLFRPMVEPITEMVLEAPEGLVRVRAHCSGGKAERIEVENLPSFSSLQNVPLEIEGVGTITVDTAFGGDSFVIVNPASLGLLLEIDEAQALSELGVKITNAANDQLVFTHPTQPEWHHHSFCLFAGDLEPVATEFRAKSIVSIQPGKLDRSPTGTAVSARMALLHAKGEMKVGDRLTGVSLIGLEFQGQILGWTTVGDVQAIRPQISGRWWVTGSHQHMLDPSDPWPEGYRLSDTWQNYK